jgi:hypothetical protein
VVRQNVNGWPQRPSAYLHAETTAYAVLELVARLRTCRPFPGIVIEAQEAPPSVVWKSLGPKAQPTVEVAKRMSVIPGFDGSPTVEIGAGTAPARFQVLPREVVARTSEQVFWPQGAEPSTHPRLGVNQLIELAR